MTVLIASSNLHVSAPEGTSVSVVSKKSVEAVRASVEAGRTLGLLRKTKDLVAVALE